MLNDQIHAQYQAVDDLDAMTNSQGNESSNEGEGEDEYSEEEVQEAVEFTKIKRENVFSQIDYTKRKAKIVCTLG